MAHAVFPYRDLVWELVKRELRVRYRRSIIGFTWTMLQPLMMMAVLQVAFSSIFRFNLVNFPVYDERGVLVAILDLAYPEYRVGLEYDGDHHRTDPAQYFHDLERLDALSGLGWRDIRVTKEHRGDRLSIALDRVGAALRERGWSGASARPATRQKTRLRSSADRIH